MKNLNPAVIRLAHPLAFARFLRHIGAPVEGYFRRQGLPTLCKDPNAFVSLRMAWGVFHDAARREDCDIGWHVGRFAGDHRLSGPLLKKLEDAPTLYQALRRLVRMVNSEASHLKVGIVRRQFGILFYTHYPGMRDEPGYRESQSYQLEVYTDLVRHFARRHWVPDEIGIEAPEAPALLRDRFPECRIRVNQPRGYIAIPRSCLYKKLCSKHKEAQGIVSAELPLAHQLNYADILCVLLEPYLQQGYLNLRFAADLMDTSARTLSRRLADNGTSYQNLVEELRFRKSCDLLREPGRPISYVAWSVGFNDQANYTRMFRRVAGIGPLEFRRAELRTLH